MRVHPEILKRQKLPPRSVGKRIWDERLADIAHFEDYLTRQGTILLKFFLHVSREEQKKRLIERLDKPRKHWKFSSTDIRERGFWADYMYAFEEAIRALTGRIAPQGELSMSESELTKCAARRWLLAGKFLIGFGMAFCARRTDRRRRLAS